MFSILNRTQKLKINSIVSLLTRIVIIISGLILPRLILSNFGAGIHGLVNSINQFLGIITFLDLGVGAVVKSALYRPLFNKDNKQISLVLTAAKKYFQKIAYVLIAYVIGLVIFYPYLIDSKYSNVATAFLIIALSISKFGQFYFGIVNELLLSANQQDYVQLGSEIVVVILNLLISIILIYSGASIQIVKLGSGLIYLIRPIYLSIYVRKNFNIDYEVEITEDPLPQRWNGLGQHIAYFIQNNTDVVILTIFTTLETISIFSVYNMVFTAVKTLVASITTGIQSFYGNLYASKEIILLNNVFDRIEWLVHTGVIYLYGMTAVLINSFIMLYTTGVEGISYEAPLFSFLLVLASIAYSLRVPYNAIVLSAGHFRETQLSSFLEAGINILISITLVNRFGLVGVAVGTLVSMTYRTLYLVGYLSKNIVFRTVKKFIKHIVVDTFSFVLFLIIGNILLVNYNVETIVDWIIIAGITGAINLIVLLIINLIFYKEIMISLFKSILRKS